MNRSTIDNALCLCSVMIRSDTLWLVSVFSTIFEVNADSSSQTMDVTGCVEMNVLRISLIASLVFRSVGIACAYLVFDVDQYEEVRGVLWRSVLARALPCRTIVRLLQ